MADTARRIDVHFHSVPKVFRDALEAAALGPTVRAPDWSPELALEMMDRNGIETVITSISAPGTHLGEDAAARALSRACNEDAAEITARFPSRFGGFAALPLPDIDGACIEARYALEDLKLDGIGLFSSYGGRHLGDAQFDPVLEILNHHCAVAFIHPTNHPSGEAVRIGMPGFLVEYPFDTTRAAINLVFSGRLDRFPDIRFILAHAGGALPYLAWRISDIAARQLAVAPFTERFPLPFIDDHSGEVDAELVLSRFRRFWYDTALSAGPETFGSLGALADPDRILFGSDWPYAPETMTRDSIKALDTPGMLTGKQRTAIARDNALALLPRLGGRAGAD